MNAAEILMLLLTTGIPGGVSYWFLYKIKVISFGDNNKEEKLTLLISLSLLNVIIITIIYLYIFKWFNFEIDILNPTHLLLFLILSFLVIGLLSYFVYPAIFRSIENKVNKHLFNSGNTVSNNLSIIDNIIKERPIDANFSAIYIFDFNNNSISSGILGFTSNKHKQISLDSDENEQEYTSVIDFFNSKDVSYKSRLIDFDANYKIFIIHFKDCQD